MDALNTLVAPYLGAITVALAVACIVLLVAVVLLVRRTSRIDRRLQSLTRGEDGRSLEAMLEAHLDKVYAVARDVDELAARSAVLEAVQRKAVQRVGLVRFNPFEDTGGNQSFALALLDINGDGVVVSSLHARALTRVYGKAIKGSKSEAALSDEESQALREAMAQASGPAGPG
ncbi:MAG: DUF4446 family protein [Chloroflexi bacterium]|nr:DUF4446 family protein [Chloroflexota bacterium]